MKRTSTRIVIACLSVFLTVIMTACQIVINPSVSDTTPYATTPSLTPLVTTPSATTPAPTTPAPTTPAPTIPATTPATTTPISTPTETLPYNIHRNVPVPREEMEVPPYDTMYSYRDATHFYYVFYLGSLLNVPLQDSVTQHRYSGVAEDVFVFKTEKSETEEISSAVSFSTTESIELELGCNLGFSPGEDAGISSGISVNLSTAFSVTSENSYSKAAAHTSTSGVERSITFTNAYPEGVYRYILMGELDVFGVLVKDLLTGEYYTDSYSIIAGHSFVLDYSDSERFPTSSEKLSFELSETEIAALPIPEKNVANLGLTRTYSTEYSKKEIDASRSYIFKDDIFDISEFSEFMNSLYQLKFSVRLYMAEKSNGYQEVYLRNHGGEGIRIDEDKYYALSYGGSDKKTKFEWIDLEWIVDGDLCTEKMALEFGAHGEHSDDWYRAQTEVTVSVIDANTSDS